MDFVGAATKLTPGYIEKKAAELGLAPDELYALVYTEAAGAGFLASGKPKILYEAHIFGRMTGHIFDGTHPNVSAPAWDRSLYGVSGEHQYERLAEAMSLNELAALQSASWGMPQILGENFHQAGYDNVTAFVEDMKVSEDYQIDALAAFCQNSDGLIDALKTKDWPTVARIYNGPGQIEFYAAKLAENDARRP